MKATKALGFMVLSLAATFCSNDDSKKGGGGGQTPPPQQPINPNCVQNPGGQTTAGAATYNQPLSGTPTGGTGYTLQTGTVTWEPTVRTLFQQSCAMSGCHDSASANSAGGFDYSTETAARAGLSSAIASVQAGRMPKTMISGFNAATFIQTLTQWQQSGTTGGVTGGVNNPYGSNYGGDGTYGTNYCNPANNNNTTGGYTAL